MPSLSLWLCLSSNSLRFIVVHYFIVFLQLSDGLQSSITRISLKKPKAWVRDGQFRKKDFFIKPSRTDQTLTIFSKHRLKPSLAKIHWFSTYFSQEGPNNHHWGLWVTQKRIITARGGPVGERMEECWQKSADRGSKLTLADTFYVTARPLWTHLCYFCSPRNCTSSRCGTFKRCPKDLTFASKSKEKS